MYTFQSMFSVRFAAFTPSCWKSMSSQGAFVFSRYSLSESAPRVFTIPTGSTTVPSLLDIASPWDVRAHPCMSTEL